ncbi:MAG: hypothetical protein ACPGYP_04690 [Solirubrobacterales bacterium]
MRLFENELDTGIASGAKSGGTNTSHTIILDAASNLFAATPVTATLEEYEVSVIEENVLGKATDGSRRRTFRYLRELYALDPDVVVFRALRDLWPLDVDAQPLLAATCAFARDSVFRASFSAILDTPPGATLTASDLAQSVGDRFPGTYGEATLAKIGRNTFSSWEQTGHLEASRAGFKTRKRATCRPSNVAYALLLATLEGVQGAELFESQWLQILDQPSSHLEDLAASASQKRLMEYRSAGGVVEIEFAELLRPFGGAHR